MSILKPALSIGQLSFCIEGRVILQQLACRAYEGDFIILQGTNGSGKSTLFDLITGRKQAQQGEVWIGGRQADKWTEQKRSLFISRMSQNTMHGCFPSLTVQENFVLASLKGEKASLKKGKGRFEKKDLATRLALIGIDIKPLLHLPMASLSGGQRQLLTFLMATMAGPSVLLLDEPTAALDPDSSETLVRLAANFIKESKAAAIMITHDKLLADSVGNKRWTLHQGKIIEEEVVR